MSATDWREELPQKVRILQIIVGAMSFGCFCLLIIAILVSQNINKPAGQPILTYLALAMAAMILVVWAVVPGIIVSQGRKKIHGESLPTNKPIGNNSTDDQKEKEICKAQALMQLLQTKTIVAGATLEGAVFFLLIVYMIESHIFSLLAALLLLILLIAQIPTTGRATNWIENQIRLLGEERDFG